MDLMLWCATAQSEAAYRDRHWKEKRCRLGVKTRSGAGFAPSSSLSPRCAEKGRGRPCKLFTVGPTPEP